MPTVEARYAAEPALVDAVANRRSQIENETHHFAIQVTCSLADYQWPGLDR